MYEETLTGWLIATVTTLLVALLNFGKDDKPRKGVTIGYIIGWFFSALVIWINLP